MAHTATHKNGDTTSPIRILGLLLGPAIASIGFFISPPDGMTVPAWQVTLLAIWMATWWITEAMPLAVTSLLPLIFLPLLGIMPLQQAALPFASTIIFLFMGGFILAIAMQKTNLHLRLALWILKNIGVGDKTILAGFMLATAFMGFWLSNTATVLIMLPVCISIIALLRAHEECPEKEDHFAKALVLGVAYSACIGGLGTFVGTPTNAILQGYLESTYGYQLDLAEWMRFGVPTVLLLLFAAWAVLVFLVLGRTPLTLPSRKLLAEEYDRLGPMSREQAIVAAVFGTVALIWILHVPIEHWLITSGYKMRLEDAVIGLLGALLLFVLPVGKGPYRTVIGWKDAEQLPWGVLIFFGGSLSISAALAATGATRWLSEILTALQGAELLIVIILVTLLLILVSELMSNIATITAFLPILDALAHALGINPILVLVPATMAASCGFMMPGASAPNALAYGTGYLRVRDMIRPGFWLDIIAALVIVGISLTLVAKIYGHVELTPLVRPMPLMGQ